MAFLFSPSSRVLSTVFLAFARVGRGRRINWAQSKHRAGLAGTRQFGCNMVIKQEGTIFFANSHLFLRVCLPRCIDWEAANATKPARPPV